MPPAKHPRDATDGDLAEFAMLAARDFDDDSDGGLIARIQHMAVLIGQDGAKKGGAKTPGANA